MARGPSAKADRLISSKGKVREDLRFWLKDKPHEAVFANWKRIGTRVRARHRQDLYFACLYDDSELATSIGGASTIGEFTPQTLATNIVRRQVDTYTAKISKNRPLPMGLTSGGNYSQQRRAKTLSKFFAGMLDEVDFWDSRTLRIRDGGIFGSGIALNWRDGRVIHHDRILPVQVRVDPRDAMFGNPRTLYIGRYVDRLVLTERFPKFATEIESADTKDDDDIWQIGLDETSDVVLVIEAWHLPSGSDADDGSHCICISNATLRDGQFEREKFPLSKMDFSPPVIGWWGEGMVKQLAGLQYEVNSVGLRLQERHYLMGTYVLRNEASDVTYETIDNGTLTEVVYSGAAPEFIAPAAHHPDLFNWFQFLRGQLPSDITGISQLAARSEKPAGLDSGKAIRTYHDIETEAFTPQGRADEQDVIDTCWQLFDLAEEIHEETGKGAKAKKGDDAEDDDKGAYVVRVEERKYGRTEVQDLSWDKVRLDKKEFILRVFPTNFLTGTPEERIQSVNELIKAGFLSQDEATVLLDFPDLEHVNSLRGAARRIVERTLETIKDASDPAAAYQYPEPAMDLHLCQALGQMTYLEAKLDGVPEENLKWILQFAVDAADQLAGKSAAPPGAPPPDAGGPPPPDAGPMPPPGAPPGPDALYAPPQGDLLPQGAVAPEAIPPVPQV